MYTVKIAGTDRVWMVNETESLLDGAQKKGIKIPYACKGGGCGLCKIKVETGEFERGRSSKAVLSDEERVINYSLACKTYPKSNLEIHLS